MGSMTYEQGYEDGESNHLADWQVALMDLLPDDVECRPSTVAAYVKKLQDALAAAQIDGDGHAHDDCDDTCQAKAIQRAVDAHIDGEVCPGG